MKTFVPGRKVDDAIEAVVEFDSGTIGTVEATRLALGRRNAFQWEINGTKGSLWFDMERMNELQVFRADGDRARGAKTVLVTEADHPFMKLWWPPGHIVGWGDTFLHEAVHLLEAIAGDGEVAPYGADFEDGYRASEICDAIVRSSDEHRRVEIAYRAGTALDPQLLRGQLRAFDPRADLLERRRAGGVSSLNGENPQSSVVPSRCDRNELRRFEHPVPNLLGRLDPRIDRVGHADEDPLVRGCQCSAIALQHARPVGLACELEIEAPGLGAEQGRQQRGVVDVGAVGRVMVAAGAGVDADPAALVGGETARAPGCSGRRSCGAAREGSSLTASLPSVKSIWTLSAPRSRQRRMSRSASSTRSSRNSSRG